MNNAMKSISAPSIPLGAIKCIVDFIFHRFLLEFEKAIIAFEICIDFRDPKHKISLQCLYRGSGGALLIKAISVKSNISGSHFPAHLLKQFEF